MMLNSQPNIEQSISFSQPIPVCTQPLDDFQSACSLSQPEIQRCGRKGVPRRSLSIHDDKPGIIFKVNHVRNQSKDWTINRIVAAHNYTSSTIAFGLTTASTSQGPNGPRTRSRSICVKPSDQVATLLDLQSNFKRPRSNSLGMEEEPAPIDYGTGELSDSDIPVQNIGMGNRARKNSMTETGYGGSLSHLVPNRLLTNLSRRISVSAAHTGCVCASCDITMTPYWRDGWSADVMLCNACGLRYQKFARRCPSCVYIPRKEDSMAEACVKCATAWVQG